MTTTIAVSAPDADMTVVSSDGTLFKVHSRNLAAHSDVFRNAADATLPGIGEDTVYLTESAETLDLLFRLMYGPSPPALALLKFETLARLAEAVEKYSVHSALTACRLQMKAAASEHPFEVLMYATRHDLPKLANDAAQRSMGRGVTEALAVLPPDDFEPWILFHERWHREVFLGHTNMLYYDSHIALVRRCVAAPNPIIEFRQKLNDASLASQRFLRKMMEMRFVPEAPLPDIPEIDAALRHFTENASTHSENRAESEVLELGRPDIMAEAKPNATIAKQSEQAPGCTQCC
ncbi:hypothetical protein C8R47DRAFT_218682 [Mycena vitilis]|nr:hypothetical protein C8R47DRAFT_218682 [Mycena vitilis]